MKTIATIAGMLCMLLTIPVLAAEKMTNSPYAVLEETGNKLFKRIADNQQEIEKFPRLMLDIVEEELMPAIDYRYASYKILGKHLKKTSAEQREQFVASMHSYLARTYSVALGNYKNQKIVFEPEKSVENKKIVAVKLQIIELNAPTIDVVFMMRKNKRTGEWKAYDMSVEGVSLLKTKAAELSNRIAKEGVDQVSVELASIAK